MTKVIAQWKPIGDVRVKNGTYVAANLRTKERIELFVTDTEGYVKSTWWEISDVWAPWFQLSNSLSPSLLVTFPPQAPISATSRIDVHIDVFGVATSGRVVSTFWRDKIGWAKTWFEIKENAPFISPPTPISAIARAHDHLDLFCIDDTGVMYSVPWYEGQGWGAWFSIPGKKFAPKSYVNAVVRNPDLIQLFAVDTTGTIQSASWLRASGWSVWSAIGNSNMFSPNAPVSFIQRPGSGGPDIFAVGTNGAVWSAHNEKGSWWPLFQLSSGPKFPTNGYVAAIAPRSEDIFVLAIDTTGTMQRIDWHINTGWGQWYPFSQPSVFTPGAPISSVVRSHYIFESKYGKDHRTIEVFTTDTQGRVVNTRIGPLSVNY
ncbi:MAG: hypothetical protein OHK0022_02700 [Roseiflexaceae bacterium]